MWPFRWGKTLSKKHPNRRQEGAWYALVVLSCINLLNLADRYVPSSVKPMLKRDLQLTDTQTALPTSSMVFVYMVTSLFFGWIADMRLMDRRIILAVGVAFWSLVTALAGFARTFGELLIFRSLVGVGEAAYMTVVPPMIADFYPVVDRNTAYTVFNLCSPLGGALGYILGAVLGGYYSWRVAFFVCGFPGVVISLLVLTINDPHPGVNDPKEMTQESEELQVGPTGRRRSWILRKSIFSDVRDIFANPHWICAELGMICTCWSIGALADWYAVFLVRNVGGATVQKAGVVLGAATMLGGIGGVFLGCKAGDAVVDRWKNGYLRMSGLLQVPSTILIFLAVNLLVSATVSYILVLLAFIFFFTYMAPTYTVMYNCMPVHLRARSGAISILLSHVLGDVISPPIVGAISDSKWGSVQTGLQITWIMTAIAALCWGLGSFLLPNLPGDSDSSPSIGKPERRASEQSLSSVLWRCEGDEAQDSDPEPEPAPSAGYGSVGNLAREGTSEPAVAAP